MLAGLGAAGRRRFRLDLDGPQAGWRDCAALPDDIQLTARAHGDMLDAALAGDVAGYRRATTEHYGPLLRMRDSSAAG